MLELLLLSLLVLYVLSLATLLARFWPPNLRTPAAGPSARPTEADLLRGPLRLRIEGTAQFPPNATKFVAAFGIDPHALRDLRVYARSGDLASFPPVLVALLRTLHETGCVSGAEAVALLFHGRPLGDGEALYFALIDLPPEPRIVAFVDRRHG
jgi:hypothetical protein